MVRKVLSAVARRLGWWGRRGADGKSLQLLKKRLAGFPRFTAGTAFVAGWHLDYVDNQALISCFDAVVLNRWNDFMCSKEDPIILDCGANIGVSVLHYKRLFPRARITAFEPDKAICSVLRKNLAANGADDVTVIEAAVWSANGEHTFYSEGADGSHLVTSQEDYDGNNTDAGNCYKVSTVRLADYLTDRDVDFIKLDIEGAEAEVLIDCADKLRKVRCLVVEFHMTNSKPRALANTLAVLGDSGFNVGINSYGPWVDLIRKPPDKKMSGLGFDQYLLIAAWRTMNS
jgi:FkbM family methyltransferase